MRRVNVAMTRTIGNEGIALRTYSCEGLISQHRSNGALFQVTSLDVETVLSSYILFEEMLEEFEAYSKARLSG